MTPPLAGIVGNLMLLSPHPPTSSLLTTACSCHRPCNRPPRQGLAWISSECLTSPSNRRTPPTTSFTPVAAYLACYFCHVHALRLKVSAVICSRRYVLKLLFGVLRRSIFLFPNRSSPRSTSLLEISLEIFGESDLTWVTALKLSQVQICWLVL